MVSLSFINHCFFIMEEDLIKFNFPRKEEGSVRPVIIKVVGVGGGGGNAVANMFRQGIKDVSFAVCNTDSQILLESEIPCKVQLGPGLGAGGDPEKGRKYAEESLEDLRTLFDDGTQMAFVTAGMGGGTGTGAAPVIARVAKSMGILTVGIVTIPFLFELKPRIAQALKGVDELRKNVDALLVINNERILELYNADVPIPAKEAFKRADDILTTAAKSIAEIITMKGNINRDFRDVEATLKNGNKAIMTTGTAKGENRVQNAIRSALNSPLLQDNDIQKSQKMLCVLYTGERHPLLINEIKQMNEFIASLNNQNINLIWGMYEDNSLDEEAKITIIATGFDRAVAEMSDLSSSQEEEDRKIDELIRQYYAVPQKGKEAAAEVKASEREEPDAGEEQVVETPPVAEKKSIVQSIKDWINQFVSA